MSRRTALVLLLGLSLARDGIAHAFWVQPSDFWLSPGAALSLTLQVGDAFSRQPSTIPSQRITRFEAIGPSGDARDARSGTVRVCEPGAYLLALETDNHAYSHQPAIRFNEYLEAEGLTPALQHRARTHQVHVDGFERYSRAAKSIVVVGPRGSPGHEPVSRPLGLRLEIVPQVSPYAMPRPAHFPVRVLYEGRALPGALVKLMNLDRDLAIADQRRTDSAGLASFTMPRSGNWLMNVVWTKRLANAPDADYDTTFSSLTFGVPRDVQ
jgi:uncharacterized GH25 family protein